MRNLSRLLPLVVVLALAGCGGHTTHQSATGSVHPPGWGGTPKGFVLPPQLPRAVPTGEMLDAISVSAMSGLHPFAVAGYTSGNWPDYLNLHAAFPSAHAISVAINASHHAACLDVEPGDAVPSQAGAWVRADIAAGFSRPCVYSDLSNMPAVRASLAAAGLARSRYLLWLAWYRFTPGLLAGFDAVQWTDRAYSRNLDESTVTLDFLRIAQPPYVTPKPPPTPLPVCFTHRIAARQCATARALIASYQRAGASSERAYVARGCVKLGQREAWFDAAITRDHSARGRRRLAYRKRALVATRRAEARLQCSLFTSRAGLYASLAKQLQAAN